MNDEKAKLIDEMAAAIQELYDATGMIPTILVLGEGADKEIEQYLPMRVRVGVGSLWHHYLIEHDGSGVVVRRMSVTP